MDLNCLFKTSYEASPKPLRRGLRRPDTSYANNGREEELVTNLGRDADNVSELDTGRLHITKRHHSPSAQASSTLTLKLKHKSAVSTDSCFGTIDETVGHMLQLCEGKKGKSVSQLEWFAVSRCS